MPGHGIISPQYESIEMTTSTMVTHNVPGNLHDLAIWLNHHGFADCFVCVERVTAHASVVMLKLSPEDLQKFEEKKNGK